MLTPEASRAAIDREWKRFVEMLTSAGGAGWSRPTRCEGWAIADLARHVHWGTSMEADAFRRSRTSASGRAEGREAGASAPWDDVRDAVGRHRAELVSEIDELIAQDLVDSELPLPYADVPAPLALQIFVMEAGVHTSDLAAALAQDDALADDVAAATWVVLGAFVPLFAAGAASTDAPADGVIVRLAGSTSDIRLAFRAGEWVVGPSGEPDVTISADDSPVLLFALGRIPLEDPRLRVDGDRDLAAGFKRYIPGP
jgi:uncharacterized protein (TIGR03083 family)